MKTTISHIFEPKVQITVLDSKRLHNALHNKKNIGLPVALFPLNEEGLKLK